MQPGNGLCKGSAPRLTVSSIEIRILHPSQQCADSDPDCPGSILGCPVSQQCSDSVLLFPSEFCAVAFHLRSPALICDGSGVIAMPSPLIDCESFLLLF
jgi:hypothetical protein